MSSLSTLPKGDSAWLLRKSIQRIMQQVSVLETNIGSSTTGNSSNNQVIFNDAGTLRGDTGLTFNKTTDTLGTGRLTTSGDAIVCSSTGDFYVGTTLSPQFKVERATGSATITGDLTVDTSTLKVDSTNNRVGIGTATPSTALNVVAGSSGINTTFDTPSAGDTRVELKNNGTRAGYVYWDTSEVRMFADSGRALTFYPSGTLAMTLNSTGLGVGVAPAATIHGYSASGAAQLRMQNGTAVTGRTWYFNSFSDGNLYIGIPTVIDALTVTPAGNVGIGVTPSAWGSTLKTIQCTASSYSSLVGGYIGATPLSVIAHNAFFDGTNWKRVNADYSSFYRQSDGTHRWELGGTGLAGATFSPTLAMTLNAAGSLVLGAAAVATTATDGFLYIPGCAGTPTGTPTAQTGRVPLVVDTTNNKLYFYSGGSWVAAN